MVLTKTADRLPFGRFLLILVLPNLIFGVMVLALSASDSVDLLTAALLAVAVGVCVAYIPGSIAFYFNSATPDGSAWLGLGISITWIARIIGSLFLIYYRTWKPHFDLVNNYAWAYVTFMYLSGGICHFVSPKAINAVIPTKRWLTAGAIVGGSMFAMFLISRLYGLHVS